jgi:tRNA threonylcarbamoyladenosine biosynthesis protein TsaB
MAVILNIETATSVCSVAISKSGVILVSEESNEGNVHAEKLTTFIESVLVKTNLTFLEIDAVAIGSGPGSYTGLRIGTSTAKGMCYGLNKPLISVSTLKAMAQAAIKKEKGSTDILFCPIIDARRLEVYAALYNSKCEEILPVHARVLNESSFSEYLNTQPIAFFGDGMPKMKNLFGAHKNIIWLEGIYASAINVAPLAEQAYNEATFADLAYYEPFYLKDFVAKKSLKN